MVTTTGGDKLTRVLADLSDKMSTSQVVEIGFLEGARYPDGTSVAMVAAIQEFGAPSRNIPPRPYFRGMIKTESPHWGSDITKLLKANDYNATRTLEKIGLEVKAELQSSINDFTTPGNAPSTIAAKGFDKPLVETGLLKTL